MALSNLYRPTTPGTLAPIEGGLPNAPQAPQGPTLAGGLSAGAKVGSAALKAAGDNFLGGAAGGAMTAAGTAVPLAGLALSLGMNTGSKPADQAARASAIAGTTGALVGGPAGALVSLPLILGGLFGRNEMRNESESFLEKSAGDAFSRELPRLKSDLMGANTVNDFDAALAQKRPGLIVDPGTGATRADVPYQTIDQTQYLPGSFESAVSEERNRVTDYDRELASAKVTGTEQAFLDQTSGRGFGGGIAALDRLMRGEEGGGSLARGGTVRRPDTQVHLGEEVIRKSEASRPGVRPLLKEINKKGAGPVEGGLKRLMRSA